MPAARFVVVLGPNQDDGIIKMRRFAIENALGPCRRRVTFDTDGGQFRDLFGKGEQFGHE